MVLNRRKCGNDTSAQLFFGFRLFGLIIHFRGCEIQASRNQSVSFSVPVAKSLLKIISATENNCIRENARGTLSVAHK
ncbi:MAG: hypothetical protein DMG35_15555 [Acidobacteria bacterium]|nr:MAG: hypothetical protein AUH86_09690 [Acidobacteria bacterium 13_1_40CM_4_58_4]PYT59101.1 MAG: hypothetical protein DMG35_15555 [Acidobacteriota bacterium]